MTATLNITDGTITVNLLSAKVDYQLLARRGYPQGEPKADHIYRESAFADYRSIVRTRRELITEAFDISIYGANQDAIATNLQNLLTLQREAREFQSTDWQKTPVYITAKTTSETGTRYAPVRDIRINNDSSLFSSTFNRKNTIPKITVSIDREDWRGTVPMTLPSAITLGAPQAPGTQADATEQFVANYRDTMALTDVYNFDDSAGTFSSNLIASTAFSYFPASPAANDIVYFGSTQGQFRFVVLRIGTIGNYNATITWEWWNGSSWVSTAGGIRENQSFLIAGNRLIVIDTPTGWATTSINSVTAYWIRARISAFTSWTTSPTQSGQVVYNPRDTYITIDANQIDGDIDALAMLRFQKYQNTTNGIRLMAMGLRSRGTADFTSRLNAGGQNPTGWSESYGTDTSEVADIESPNGSHALCTFATSQSLVTRVQLTQATAARAENFEGEYQAYVRCQQIGGSAGAVSLRLAHGDGSVNYNIGTATLTSADAGVELVNMGRVSLFPARVIGNENTTGLIFFIQASATSSTPDLRVYDLILIPIDEWSYVAASDSTIGPSSLPGINTVGGGLDIDGGVIRTGKATVKLEGSSDEIQRSFEGRGKPPALPPDKAVQIHFLFSDYSNTVGLYESDNCLGGSIRVYPVERWVFMRGAE